ncbi:MAG: GSCFA domain-containing protein [Pseudoruegeria sp.]
MNHPYVNLPSEAFWRSGVAEVSALELEAIYTPRFPILKSSRIAAAGSCFAQHIGRQFKSRGYGFLDVEPAPALLAKESWDRFGFNMYSARYGNVYSARQLLQLFQRAAGTFTPQEECWEKNGRFFDPFRPSIEPNGFESRAEMEKDRAYHLAAVKTLLEQADLFVFTFGLTEGWECLSDGAALPTCPGTIAGEYDDQRYGFRNFTYPEVLADFEAFMDLARAINPDLKFLITVSPVPLTATASGEHVLAASSYSKSVLRAVCGDLKTRHDCVDYFPSYELVSSHPMRAMFFRPNLRSVSPVGVAHVMETFFEAHGDQADVSSLVETGPPVSPVDRVPDEDDVACDEVILESFGR